jgi:hypothetical protein
MKTKRRLTAAGFLVLGILFSGCTPSTQNPQGLVNVPTTEIIIPTDSLIPTPKPTEAPDFTPALFDHAGGYEFIFAGR